MTLLLIGLIVFLGVHSIRIVADDWRTNRLSSKGEASYKGLYSIVSGLGLALIIWGYGLARASPVELWSPPVWARHLAGVLMVLSLALLLAAYVPGSKLKAWAHHPMVLGVKVWAFAHLIANGRLADVLLFGGFFVWAVLNFRAARQRDRAADVRYPAGSWSRDAVIWLATLVLWWLFVRYLHAWLIGVNPFAL